MVRLQFFKNGMHKRYLANPVTHHTHLLLKRRCGVVTTNWSVQATWLTSHTAAVLSLHSVSASLCHAQRGLTASAGPQSIAPGNYLLNYIPHLLEGVKHSFLSSTLSTLESNLNPLTSFAKVEVRRVLF